MRPIPLLVLGLLLLAAVCGAPSAGAAPGDVTVPNVGGRPVESARQALEAEGLVVVVVDEAGPPVGQVSRQDPPAGARVAPGTQVLLRVGLALRIDTRVPDLRGQRLPDVGRELETAYVLEVELVPGAPADDGRVLDQSPAPGSSLPFRGVLTLRVVQGAQPGPVGVVVPSLLGRAEADAAEVLRTLGLASSVEYVNDPARPAGTVISQTPASGTEMLSGGTVFLRVSGTPQPVPPAPGLPAPNLVGLSMNAALEAAQALGFVPQAAFQVVGGQTPWTCVQQDPPAGTPLAAGATLTLVVALPAAQPQQVTVPTLFGLTHAQAAQILSALGLSAQVLPAPSGFPVGLVFAQQPQAGSSVARGSPVRVFVALGGGGPGGTVRVPAVIGQSAAQAYAALRQAGLKPVGLAHLAPGAAVEVVDQQAPAPGATVPAGSEVRYFVPLASVVPALIGRSRTEAVALLQQAGFNPQPQGPAFGIGATVVIAQGAPAGVPLARGSDVPFAFKFSSGGGIPVKVQVPGVVGQSKDDAVAALQQKGLGVDLQHQGPILPGPGTRVTAQSPPAGALVNPGTVVQLTYVELPSGGPPAVPVPSLIGLSLPEAQQALQQAQLNGQFQAQGPSVPGAGTRVVAQDPPPGSQVPAGTTVRATYLHQPVPQVQVLVPNVVGQQLADAQQALAQKNLTSTPELQGPPLPFARKVVVGQQPAPGTPVPPGSSVKLVYVHQGQGGGPPGAGVSVPQLVGLTRLQAEAALQSVGLSAQVQGPPGPASKRRVVAQSPVAGTRLSPGSPVTLTVVVIP